MFAARSGREFAERTAAVNCTVFEAIVEGLTVALRET